MIGKVAAPRPLAPSRRDSEVTKQSAYFFAQFFPMHNHVDQTVFLQKFRGLKSLRQVLMRGFLNHAWSGETDHAFGSAIITSPNEAKLAITPAVVGFVRTGMYSSFSSA